MWSTVTPIYNDYPWDPKRVAIVDSWSLLRCHLGYYGSNWDLKIVGSLLFTSGRYSEVVVSSGLNAFYLKNRLKTLVVFSFRAWGSPEALNCERDDNSTGDISKPTRGHGSSPSRRRWSRSYRVSHGFRWPFFSHFWPLLKRASLLEADKPVLKIDSNQNETTEAKFNQSVIVIQSRDTCCMD